MVSLLPEFSVANSPQGSYTLEMRRTVSGPGRRSAWPFPESLKTEGLARVSASLGCGTFHRLNEFSASSLGRAMRLCQARHIGRGRMTTGSTKPDAQHFSCAFVIVRSPVHRLASSARANGAVHLNLSAAHCATHRRPVRRSRLAGARRPGAGGLQLEEPLRSPFGLPGWGGMRRRGPARRGVGLESPTYGERRAGKPDLRWTGVVRYGAPGFAGS